ncbi:MAG: beta-ketoacyl synthase N-terminal-like domain-containing protein, partial [Candidatus Omnitrophota bacterium]|nr:beta-ketoacyl synthase N-terminal-like domain-containing protein [Candidatus Omnitrophota bacterium]
MIKKQKIVITGIGPLMAGGSGNDKVWKAVSDRKTGLIQKEYKIDAESIGKFYVHEIKDFDINDYGINDQALNGIKEWKEGEEIADLHYFLAVIKMAFEDSGLKMDDKTKEFTGLILAHENIGLDHFYRKIIDEMSFTGENSADRPATKKGFLYSFYEKFHRTGYELQTFMPLHHIAKAFDVHGFSLFLNNACASGLYALEAAADVIRSGKCDQMVVAAVDRSSVFKHIWFNKINMLAKDGRIKPFASDRDGFTIGDGGAALILESMESALERKAHIYAEYLGGSFILEGWKVTYPDVAGSSYEKMILRAIDSAGINLSDLDLLIPHGVGTGITDKYEAKTISRIFGDKSKRPVIS